MAKDKYILLFFSLATFFFCASSAFLCYVFFFNSTSGWIHILLNQLLSALSLSVLISSAMIIVAIIVNYVQREPKKEVSNNWPSNTFQVEDLYTANLKASESALGAKLSSEQTRPSLESVRDLVNSL